VSPLLLCVLCFGVQMVLNAATQESDNPDLRDRAYVYWRLLSSDPEAAKDVVLAEKPTISDEASGLDPDLLAELLRNIATLSSVYQKPPGAFVSELRAGVPTAGGADAAPSFGGARRARRRSTATGWGAGERGAVAQGRRPLWRQGVGTCWET